MCIFILLRKTRILWLVFLFLFLFCTGDTSLTTTDKAPQTPANITAKGLDSKIILRWDSAATATSYTIYWSTDTADPTKLSKIQGIGATAYTHSPLVNGVAYYYRVSAVNSAGESPLSAVVKAIPTTEVSVPLPPDNVMAKKGDKKNTLFWDSSAQAISYNLYWSFNSPVTKSDSAIKEITSPFEHMNLTNGKSYYYRLSALNAAGESGLSSEVTAKPAEILIPPLPPQGVKAFPQNAAVTLTWLPDTAASAYTLYWSKTTPVTKSDSMNSGLKSPYLHGNRINGTTYYYRITSSNSAGESGLSQEVSAVPDSTTGLPEIPKNLKALAGDKKVTLT